MNRIIIFIVFIFTNSDVAFSQNKVLSFDGTSNYIDILNSGQGSAFDFTTDSFTIETWLIPYFITSTTNNEYTIIGKDDINNNTGYVFRTGGNRKLSFSFNNGVNWYEVVTLNPVLNFNQWQHVAVTKSNGTITLFVDGQIVKTENFNPPFNINSSAVTSRIGASGTINNRKFRGILDELKIWNIALSQTEIQNDMIETCPTFSSNLLAYYKFNDSVSTPFNIKCENNINFSGILNGLTNIYTTLLPSKKVYYNHSATTLYVDSNNANVGCGHQNGMTWSTAFPDLNVAIKESHSNPRIEKILVAKGTYYPSNLPFEMSVDKIGSEMSSTNNFDKTFHIRAGIELIGGYASGGSSVPNFIINKTILDGSHAGGVISDTANNVIYIDSPSYWVRTNDTTKIIGFTIRNGHSKLQNFSLNPIDISMGYGGGIYCQSGTILIENNEIYNNKSENGGTGIASVANKCIIRKNSIYKNGIKSFSSNESQILLKFGKNFIVYNIISGGEIGIYSEGGNNTIIKNEISNHTDHGIFLNTFASTLTNIDSNYIHHNTGSQGAGIYVYDANNTKVRNNIITDNVSIYKGGGLYAYGCNNIHLLNNYFENDSANNGDGGALLLENSLTNKIESNIFLKNYCSNSGSAIYSNTSSSTFTKNILDSNVAGNSCAVNIGGSDLVFSNNVVTNNNGNGIGGILLYGNNYLFVNNIIANNTGNNKGGIVCGGDGKFVNNTIYNNKGGTVGGLEIYYGSNHRIYNNIFWNNKIGNSNVFQSSDYFLTGGSVTFKNNSLQLDSLNYSNIGSGNYDIGINSKNNYFAINPSFIDTSDFDGNDNIDMTSDDGLHLKFNSALINKGMDSLFPTFLYGDLANNGRIDGSSIDCGAYELTCIPSNSTLSSLSTICQGNYTNLTAFINYPSSNLLWFNNIADTISINVGNNFTTPILLITDTFWVQNTLCISSFKTPFIVNVNPNTYFTIFDTTCSSYNFNNQLLTSSGTYYDTLINASGCDSIITLNLVVNNINNSVIQNGFNLSSTVSGGVYQWITCNPYTFINGETNQSYTATNSGDYAVIITQNNCVDTSNCTSVLIAPPPILVQIFPNPTNSNLKISNVNGFQNATVNINSLMGQTVLQKKNCQGKVVNIDISSFKNGIYITEIFDNNQTYQLKFIKQ